jgi:Flp pilus assembly protein TadB
MSKAVANTRTEKLRSRKRATREKTVIGAELKECGEQRVLRLSWPKKKGEADRFSRRALVIAVVALAVAVVGLVLLLSMWVNPDVAEILLLLLASWS